MRNLNLNSRLLSTVLITLFALFLGAGVGQQLHAQNLVYVQQGGTGNGSSWGDAYGQIQDAYAAAQAGDVIVVAAGTYYPTEGSNQFSFFRLDKSEVNVYGGYAGTEMLAIDDLKLEERDLEANPTILSGDINQSGNSSGNSHRVVLAMHLNSDTIIDGFTITGGIGQGGGVNSQGAGMNVIDGAPVFRNLIIEHNQADGHGGGIRTREGTSATFINTIIRYNKTPNNGGGGVMIDTGTQPVFINTIIHDNEAYVGGGVYNVHAQGVFINSVIAHNVRNSTHHAWDGSGFSVFGPSSVITFKNSIVAHNEGLSNGFNGDGTMQQFDSSIDETGTAEDPYFVDPDARDYRLSSASSLVNAGNNEWVPSNILTDLNWDDRIQDGVVNIGTYETVVPAVIYVKEGGSGDESGRGWSNALGDINEALSLAIADDVIVVAAGFYTPTTNSSDRHASFNLKSDVRLYGGYEGTEQLTSDNLKLDERDWYSNATRLSGDINNTGNHHQNSYSVVDATPGNENSIIDGFYIRHGNASGSGDEARGGGIYFSDLNVRNSPQFRNLVVENNMADSGGGLFMRDAVDVSFTNVIFRNNISHSQGSAVYFQSVSVPDAVFMNNLFYGNSGGSSVVYSWNYYVDFINSTFSNNSSTVIVHNRHHFAGVSKFLNTIIWGNSSGFFSGDDNNTIQHSNIEGQGGVNPEFRDSDDNDYRLVTHSPLLNTGSNNHVPSGVDTDLLGHDRIQNGTVSPGPYESSVEALPNLIYVQEGGTGDGSSWGNARGDLRQVILDAIPWIDTIVVAGGTYYPAAEGNDFWFFEMRNGVSLYGGYAGDEVISPDDLKLDERDLEANPSILSGDINQSGDFTGNSQRVVRANQLSSNTIIDGFTITATHDSHWGTSAGITLSGGNPVLRNLIVEGNKSTGEGNNSIGTGAGVRIDGLGTSPTFINCIIRNNTAHDGAGIYVRNGAQPVFINTLVHGNESSDNGGGIMVIGGAKAEFINSTIVHNQVDTEGGGGAYRVRDNGSEINLKNSVIWGNPEPQGVTESGGNSSISDSFVEDASGTNPQLNNPDNGDYRPKVDSPLINAGNNDWIPSDITTDLLGDDRIQNGTVNIGAYETGVLTFWFVSEGGSGDESGSSWENAMGNLQDALSSASDSDVIVVSAGIYLPTSDSEDREARFNLKNNVRMYGGYAGNEVITSSDLGLDQRDWRANATILSGNITGDPESDKNSFTVVYSEQVSSNTELDGFYIEHAYATAYNEDFGEFRPDYSERGGGVFDNRSDTIYRNLIIRNNYASVRGGGMYLRTGSNPQVLNVTFKNNHSDTGGAVYIREGRRSGPFMVPQFINSEFYDNTSLRGGAVGLEVAYAEFINSVFVNNSSTTIQENNRSALIFIFDLLYSPPSNVKFRNSIAWGHESPITNLNDENFELFDSNFQDYGGVDPLFVDEEGRNFRLRHDSPLIDAGSSDHLPEEITTDLDDNPRFFGPVDLGPYEFGTQTSISGDNTTDDFRFLGSPAGNVTLGELFEPFWSQGIPGSDAPQGVSTLHFWNAETGEWQHPAHMNDMVQPGQGYLKYIYDDQNYDGEPDGFPKMWGLQGVENSDQVSVEVFGNASTEGMPTGWNMLSNPWVYAISVDALMAELAAIDENVNRNIYIWDPNKEQTGSEPDHGEYRILPEGSDEIIPPFQSFFVWFPDDISGGSAQLILNREDMIVTESSSLYSQPEKATPLVFSIDHEVSGSMLELRPDERVDHIDNLYSATRLSGFRSNYSLLYAEGSRGPLSRVHLPEQIEIPLELNIGLITNQHGEFTLRWDDLPAEWASYEVILTDLIEDQSIPVLEGGSYTFYIESEDQARMMAGDETLSRSTGERNLSGSEQRAGSRDVTGERRETSERRSTAVRQVNTERQINAGRRVADEPDRRMNASSTRNMEDRDVPKPGALVAGTGDQAGLLDGMPTRFVLTVTPTSTSTDPLQDLPQELSLNQNYPNPFNPTTVIEYGLPETTEVRIDVFNTIGQRVQTLVNGTQQAGHHIISFDASRLSSGVYLYRIQSGNKTITRKMMLIK